MADLKVETISRMAQWKQECSGPIPFRKSEPFKIGIWNWHLAIEKSRYLTVRLFPEPSRIAKEQPPIAKFLVRVWNSATNRKPFISPIHERLIRSIDDFSWSIDSTFHGRFTIDVEFLDLKIFHVNAHSNQQPYLHQPLAALEIYPHFIETSTRSLSSPLGSESCSIWPTDGMVQSLSTESSLRCLSRMLEESIHTDITITTGEGSLRAHKSILAASSPVFETMFLHNLKEQGSSTIHIEDMSLESCSALLSYLYGSIKQEDFWKHRLELLGAANKYDIAHIRDSCEQSLLEDINTANVLDRLQEASLYQLNNLKKGCLTYLFDFGKVHDIRDEIALFFKNADRELMNEMFQEVLTAWKPA